MIASLRRAGLVVVSPKVMRAARRRLLLAAAAAFCLAIATMVTAACSHESPVAPAMAGACNYQVSPSTTVAPSAAGDTFQVFVTTGAISGCPWTLSTSDAWIHPVGAASGQSAGTVVVAVDAMATSTFGRQGTVSVSWAGGSQSIRVSQGCVASRTVNLTAESQLYELSVGSSCSFAVNNSGGGSLDVPWINFLTTSGNGSLLDFRFEKNTGPERTGHLTAAWGQITFIQAKGDCVTAIEPASQAFDENGGTGTISVTGVPGCAWDAMPRANAGTLTIVAGDHGSGNGLLTLNLAVNTTPFPQLPDILFAGPLRFQITQSACPVTVSPLEFQVTAAGGSFFVTVMSRQICHWSAPEESTFITHPFVETTGPGTVSFSVAQNQTGKSRLGLLNVANKDVIVRQDP